MNALCGSDLSLVWAKVSLETFAFQERERELDATSCQLPPEGATVSQQHLFTMIHIWRADNYEWDLAQNSW